MPQSGMIARGQRVPGRAGCFGHFFQKIQKKFERKPIFFRGIFGRRSAPAPPVSIPPPPSGLPARIPVPPRPPLPGFRQKLNRKSISSNDLGRSCQPGSRWGSVALPRRVFPPGAGADVRKQVSCQIAGGGYRTWGGESFRIFWLYFFPQSG